MREYPETEKGKELFYWMGGFVAATVDEPGTVRYEHLMDEVSNMLCDLESDVRREEREMAFDKSKKFAALVVELAMDQTPSVDPEEYDSHSEIVYSDDFMKKAREVIDSQRRDN